MHDSLPDTLEAMYLDNIAAMPFHLAGHRIDEDANNRQRD
jgi:hypothetical protein